MKKLQSSIVLSVITAAVVAGLLVIDCEEKVPETFGSIHVAGEGESVQLPAELVPERSTQYAIDTGTSLPASSSPNPPAGNAQMSALPTAVGHAATHADVSSPEVEPSEGAQGISFGESAIAERHAEPSPSRDASTHDRFDYSKIQRLYVLKGDIGYVYATHPTFLQYRAMIIEKMRDAGLSDVDFTKMIYEIRAVGIGEETTLFVGDSWMDDGERSAELSDEELSWLRWAYESRNRNGKGLSRQEIEASIQFQLEQQRDPAWRPAP